MRIRVDWDLCQGHGTCVAEAPELFRLDSNGDLEVILEAPPEALHAKLAAAIRFCPTKALATEEDGTG